MIASVRITILGSGTCVPSLKKSSCAFLIEFDTSKLLFDMGCGTMRRLLEAGVSIFEVTHIFLSHTHPDHMAELVPFLFSTKYAGYSRKRPLTIVGSRTSIATYYKLYDIYGHLIDMNGKMNIVEFDDEAVDHCAFDDFATWSYPVNHVTGSIGFRVDFHDGRSIAYSGDSDYCRNLVILARDTDVFICESSFPDGLKKEKHLTPSLAGEIALEAGTEHLVLTHMYPECDDYDIESQCRKSFTGKITIAEDLMTIII